ncbi:hypothetical protein [Nocardia brasiliensis]|uniref:hypothetical protein n=1 Tax=Nocardia brasiliensis TaxID=37326 RepID=UPI00245509EB|nr:hypothetical protein [Nocardia brasiliensis]
MTRTISTIPEWDAFVAEANETGVVADGYGPIGDLLCHWFDCCTPVTLVARRYYETVVSTDVFSIDFQNGDTVVNLSTVIGPLTWSELASTGVLLGRRGYKEDCPREVRETSRALHESVARTRNAA